MFSPAMAADLPLPLLHVVQAATHVTTVDPAVLTLALLAFGVVMVWLWLPRPFSFRRAARSRVMRGTLAMLVFFAVLPGVLPYEHLIPGAHDDGPAGEAVHAAHCHIAPGSCSDVPLASGAGQFIVSDPLVIVPTMLAVLIVLTTPALRGISLRPDTRPPRRTSIASI
jgi:hypothetical protein